LPRRRATSFPSLSRDIFSKHIGDLLRPIREPRDVNDTAGQLAEKNQNRLVVEAQENLGALNADSTRLKQILLNLLSNCGRSAGAVFEYQLSRATDGRRHPTGKG
jgi:K+-sensing histidine kinase KdpD